MGKKTPQWCHITQTNQRLVKRLARAALLSRKKHPNGATLPKQTTGWQRGYQEQHYFQGKKHPNGATLPKQTHMKTGKIKTTACL